MQGSRPDRLYLEDLHVGQRFTSATHTIDEAQIKTFAAQFDPQPFHLDEAAASARSSRAWPQAGGTRLRSRCG